ncbi:MAG TPA: DMT family transporter [Acidimicrobiales bacterium]|nr:DMT family transporter [Acidimicrobiales bacterium]
MSLLFALLAALSNAVNVITQHVASTSNPDESKGWRFVWYLVSNPLWLFGGAALIGAFVFQAIALHNGPLSIVQTLLMTDLVFSLVLRRLWIRQSISLQAWTAAVVTCVAVSVFIVTAEPRGGHTDANSRAWTATIIACAASAGVLALLGTRGSPSRRAALLAISSSVVWALEATFIKAMTDTLTGDGVGGAFLHWPVYAVAVGGIIGTLLTQAALHVGPLRASQPFLVIVDPLVSILLSVYLFGEYFTSNIGDLIVASASFTILCVGVVSLTRSAPETMERDL